MIEISVRDTGQGIAPQYIDRVFDRYFRVPGTKMKGPDWVLPSVKNSWKHKTGK